MIQNADNILLIVTCRMLEIGTKVAAPTLIRIPSGTIHSRGREQLLWFGICLNDNVGWRFWLVVRGVH
jgi:hypothetical protein